VTEEEAKKKWCPMVRAINHGQTKAASNRDIDGDIFNKDRCIASDCMMWRENKQFIGNQSGTDIYSTDGGYCGLVGKE
jgi:hypothetical protein